jgi:predicted nucleotide-binding protein
MPRSKSPRPNEIRRLQGSFISRDVALRRLRKSLEQIPELRTKGRKSPFLTTWCQNTEGVIHDFFGPDSWQFQKFKEIDFYPGWSFVGMPESDYVKVFQEGAQVAEAYLQSRISELEEESRQSESATDTEPGISEPLNSRKIFVVHGHDHGTKETVARFLSKLDLDPIILHEMPDKGRTLIEKFEDHADVACAVAILSPDDIASPKNDPAVSEERARQNVILESGFFVGRLGRERTFALLLNGVTKPSDIDGVLYIPFERDSWRMLLLRELKAAGLDIDANKAF